MQRDRSPIDQAWLQHYCDQFLKIAQDMPQGGFKDAILLRTEHVLDILDAWQLRNMPIGEQEAMRREAAIKRRQELEVKRG